MTRNKSRAAGVPAKTATPSSSAAPLVAPARPDWIVILILCAVALLVRLLLWKSQSIPSVDGTAYIRIARSFAGGAPVETVHQYGYPLLVWLVHFVVPDWIVAARVVALMGGMALVPLTWFLAAAFVRNRWLRALPVAAMALTPLPVRYSLTTMTDMPFLALLFGLLLLAARGRWLSAGLLGGLAYVVRPEGLMATLVVAALQWRRPERWRLVLAGALVFVVPYVVAVGLKDGRWTLTPKAINIAAGSWEAAEAKAGEAPLPLDLGERLRRFGGETARLYPGRAVETAHELLRHAGWLPVPVGLAGLLGPPILLVAGLVQILFLPLTFIGARVRYIFPFLPILWILSMAAVERLRAPAGRIALALALAGTIGLAAWQDRALYTLNEDGWFPELVEAGEWLRDLAGPSTVVYDRKPYTAFYAGAEGRYTPNGSYEAILAEVVARGGDYLVINDWVTERFRPELLPLARDGRVVAAERRLSPIYFEQSTRGMRTIVYRVVRPGGPPPIPGEEEIRASVIQVLTPAAPR